jgi:hypothetical protein
MVEDDHKCARIRGRNAPCLLGEGLRISEYHVSLLLTEPDSETSAFWTYLLLACTQIVPLLGD